MPNIDFWKITLMWYFKQLFDGLEKEIKKEIMSEMKNEAYKLKTDLSFKNLTCIMKWIRKR